MDRVKTWSEYIKLEREINVNQAMNFSSLQSNPFADFGTPGQYTNFVTLLKETIQVFSKIYQICLSKTHENIWYCS